MFNERGLCTLPALPVLAIAAWGVRVLWGTAMTDACDIGADREAEMRSDALARVARQSHMEPLGFCYNCDEVVFEGCFCNTDCRDDFEQRERAQRLNK